MSGHRRPNHDGVLGVLSGSSTDSPPPLAPELEEELSHARPVRPRRPRFQLALTALISLVYAGALAVFVAIRRDLEALPLVWVASYAALWLVCFVGLAYVATVPAPGEVMPRWRKAGLLAAVATAGLAIAGLAWAPQAPGLSVVHPPTLGATLQNGNHCFRLGLAAAVVPVALAALALRGAVPVGSRWVGFALGIAGGSLGGLLLHFHCAIATPLHVGIMHTGMVLAAGLLGALIVPRLAR